MACFEAQSSVVMSFEIKSPRFLEYNNRKKNIRRLKNKNMHTKLHFSALLMQSAYALGLGVLTMAIAPRILEAFGGKVDASLSFQFAIYATGFAFNWLFTFVLWHYYWYMEKQIAGVHADPE